MASSVVYQETKNNFTNTKQTINNQQIVSVKLFPDLAPNSTPDFIGQLALCSDSSGRPLVYIGAMSGMGVNGWDLVSFSGDSGFPDEVVMEDRPNDFSDTNQTIKGAQIAYMTYGTRSELLEPIQGEGHIYIRQDDPANPKMFIAVVENGVSSWKEIKASSEVDGGSLVYKDKPNDFSSDDQKIGGHPIATLWTGSRSPIDLGFKPSRAGLFFLQLSESSEDRKAHMWVSVNGASATDFKWEYIDTASSTGTLPATVVQTDKVNNFQPYEQKICGKQILSVVDGGDKTPAQSGIKADYEGQLYYAARIDSYGQRNVSYWFSYKNSWQPLLGGIDKLFASLETSNVFQNPIQILGELGDNRFITGARVKRGVHSPLQDASWKASVEGEVTVYVDTNTTPNKKSVWVAVGVNTGPTNTGEWVRVWDENHPLGQDFAYTDRPNQFTPGQQIGVGTNLGTVVTSRFGANTPLVRRLVPYMDGELYIQRLDNNEHQAWIAMEEADPDSWVKLKSGADDTEVAKTTIANLFVKGQLMGTTGDHVELTGARRGADAPLGNIIPLSTGELYIHSIRDSYDYNMYIATEAGNSATWKKIFSTYGTEGQLLTRIEELEKGYVTHDNQINDLDQEQKDLATAFQGVEEAFNQITTDFDGVKDNLEELGERLVNVEQKVTILENNAKALTDEVDELKKTLIEVKTKAEFAETCLTETVDGFLEPTTFKIVDYVGQIYLQKSAGKQDVWLGISVGSTDWVKLTNNL